MAGVLASTSGLVRSVADSCILLAEIAHWLMDYQLVGFLYRQPGYQQTSYEINVLLLIESLAVRYSQLRPEDVVF
jgi:hypothetical protein